MPIKELLDRFIEESIGSRYPSEVSAQVLLCEDCCLYGEDFTALLKDELLEARRYGPRMQKRRIAAKRRVRQKKVVRRQVQGGGKVLIRRISKRKDPGAIRRGRLAAMKGKAARKRAANNPATKRKRQRTMRIRAQLGLSKAHSVGAHGTRRHGPPRFHIRRAQRRRRF